MLQTILKSILHNKDKIIPLIENKEINELPFYSQRYFYKAHLLNWADTDIALDYLNRCEKIILNLPPETQEKHAKTIKQSVDSFEKYNNYEKFKVLHDLLLDEQDKNN